MTTVLTLEMNMSLWPMLTVSALSHLPFPDAQNVHQTDSSPGRHDQ